MRPQPLTDSPHRAIPTGDSEPVIRLRDNTEESRGRAYPLTVLVARGHDEELAMHLRAAQRNGLTNEEISELLLQTAIYCGVPEANSAFRIASEVLSISRRHS